MSESTKRPFRLGPLLAAGLLVLVGLISMALQYRLATAGADQADWDRAAELAIELAQPTDGIRVHPAWSEAALPTLRPVGNLLNRQNHPLLEDLLGIERLLILTETDRAGQSLTHLPFDAQVDSVHELDTVQLLEVPIPENLRIAGDMVSQLSQANVSYISDQGQLPCRWHNPSGAWRCDGSREGAMIRPTLLEIEHEPRRCIQAFPPPGEQYLSIELRIDDPADLLRLRAGLDQRAARLEGGRDIIYRLFIDDELVADERVQAYTSRWQTHDIPTVRGDESVTMRLELESIAEEPHHRRFCFNAWPLTDAQAAL